MPQLRTRLKVLMAEKALRENRKITQQVVAAETGVSQSTLSKYANDSMERIERETLVKLCVYFDCDVGDLLFIDREAA